MAAQVVDISVGNPILPEMIVLDTSILVRALVRRSGFALRFLRQLDASARSSDTLVLIPTVVLEEYYFNIVKYQLKNSYSSNWETAYKSNPGVLQPIVPLLRQFESALKGLAFVVVGPQDLINKTPKPLHEMMLDHVANYQLMPKDAYIAAEAEHLGVRCIATADRDFDRLTGFMIYREV